MTWKDIYKSKLLSVEEAAAKIKSHDRVVYPPCGSAPSTLIEAIGRRYKELEDVTMTGVLLLYPFDYMKGEYRGHIRHHAIFMGPYERRHYAEGNMDLTSYAFSQSDRLVQERIKPTVSIIEVSAPDEDGNMSYGSIGTFYSAAANACAETVILQVNREVPYVFGTKDAFINVRDATWICEADHKVAELPQPAVGETDRKIASFVLERLDDGITLQLGIGGVANAIGFSLDRFKDIGIHTEMLTDSMMDLAQKGVITGSRKTLHPGEMTIGFGLGSTALYKFMDRNPAIKAYPISYITDPRVIGQNKNFVSINSTLMCDLTGQACSESIGFDQFSGTGGQIDFVRGSAFSEGGRSFLCFPSTAKAKDGSLVSRINVALPPGAVVTTPRTDSQNFVTEYGIANIHNDCVRNRVQSLVRIAHPQFRDALVEEARKVGLISKTERIVI
ncbi:MAG: acetyl-CoA hydrolase/transferase C-terminal domain-containing protein [Rhodospirillaceae bacterium]|nr:acetyl-CoA hydrolase/transferase C-terminal domain-containing protein [Rhodospirillaceae bacterium]